MLKKFTSNKPQPLAGVLARHPLHHRANVGIVEVSWITCPVKVVNPQAERTNLLDWIVAQEDIVGATAVFQQVVSADFLTSV